VWATGEPASPMGQSPMTPPLPKLSVGVPSDVASCEAGRARSKPCQIRAPTRVVAAQNAAEGPLVSGQTGPRSGCVCNTPAKSQPYRVARRCHFARIVNRPGISVVSDRHAEN